MGFVIVGLLLFAGAALFGDEGYTWLVALTGALAVCYGVCIIVLRSRSKGGAGPLRPPWTRLVQRPNRGLAGAVHPAPKSRQSPVTQPPSASRARTAAGRASAGAPAARR